MATAPPPAAPQRLGLGAVLLLGAAVSVALGVYARVHTPAGRPVMTLGFSSALQMKAWLATAAMALLVVQLVTALWMWGRLPGARDAPRWAGPLHRWSGSSAFVLTVPVALHCMWSLGLASDSTRVLVHGVLGCVFYGSYAAKMLALRMRGLPAWALPVLGGTVLGTLVLVWLTSALWFFTRSGLSLT
jgi:Family of unknown function (DUF6529)